jgi:pyruvate,orthophosphate dikinase
MKNTQAINVFGFGKSAMEPNDELLGGKGAKLAEMSTLGLPVPAGVTITTEHCNTYFNIAREDRAEFIHSLVDDVLSAYKSMPFDYMPLVSVRSGARRSMPGMMDTVLNVGISIANKHEWDKRLGKDTADDCFRRLITMYSDVVLGIPHEIFEDCGTDPEMFLQRYTDLTGQAFPISLEDQLAACIEAVFNSWFSERAVAYRAAHGYPEDWGTAVNVQTMVFGNAGDDSCSGVLFTRDFNTGDCSSMIIDWLPNAQGEDVVAGTHNPLDKVALMEWNQAAADELHGYASQLEEHYNDMQDIEFTVEKGKVYILQTRAGKRAALAAFQIAYDMCRFDKITKAEALARVSGREYMALTAAKVDPEYDVAADVVGTPASGSIVSGIAVMTAADAIKCKEPCILVAKLTTPDDFSGMQAAVGIVTQTGGITSHAAVVARGMNKTCVVGAENLKFAGLAGKRITLNGKTGEIWIDKDVPVSAGEVPAFVEEMLGWANIESNGMLSVAPEKVQKGGTYYIDVSDRLHTQTTLSKALDSLKGGTGIISFGNNTQMSESDATFLGYFGVDSASTPDGDFMVIEKVLSMGKWNATFKKNWAIHLPNDASVHYANVLRSHGWNVVSRVNSFKAALSTDGYVVLEQSFLDQLDREGMEFSEIEALITKAGRTVKSIPETVSETQLIFDALGG